MRLSPSLLIAVAASLLGVDVAHCQPVVTEDTPPPSTPSLRGTASRQAKTAGITWLATYPNSGTTYTLFSVTKASRRAHGYNGKRDPTLVEIFPSPEGTGSSDPNLETGPWAISFKPLPDGDPLVKTHCGGFADGNSDPIYDVLSPTEFLESCRRTSLEIDGKVVHRSYSQELVKKAVHLIRDPFDNVVARFNYERKSFTGSLEQGQANWDPSPQGWGGHDLYEPGPNGFKNWCRDADSQFSEEKKRIYGLEAWEVSKSVPCSFEFWQWVQWHNNAFEALGSLNIPVLELHYEDYHFKPSSAENSAFATLMDFIDYSIVGDIPDFKWHPYHGFFTDKEKEAAAVFIRLLASRETKISLERYFVGIASDKDDGESE